MDEPTSALDPRATEAIEERILAMKAHRSIVLVTHNLDQARRLTDWVACLCADHGHGELLESACCDAFFASDTCQRVFDQLDTTPSNAAAATTAAPCEPCTPDHSATDRSPDW